METQWLHRMQKLLQELHHRAKRQKITTDELQTRVTQLQEDIANLPASAKQTPRGVARTPVDLPASRDKVQPRRTTQFQP